MGDLFIVAVVIRCLSVFWNWFGQGSMDRGQISMPKACTGVNIPSVHWFELCCFGSVGARIVLQVPRMASEWPLGHRGGVSHVHRVMWACLERVVVAFLIHTSVLLFWQAATTWRSMSLVGWGGPHSIHRCRSWAVQEKFLLLLLSRVSTFDFAPDDSAGSSSNSTDHGQFEWKVESSTQTQAKLGLIYLNCDVHRSDRMDVRGGGIPNPPTAPTPLLIYLFGGIIAWHGECPKQGYVVQYVLD